MFADTASDTARWQRCRSAPLIATIVARVLTISEPSRSTSKTSRLPSYTRFSERTRRRRLGRMFDMH